MEIWKDIKGYEGVYRISSTGRLQRWLKKTKQWSKDKKLILQKNGYYKCSLSLNSEVKSYWVHSLVAINFLNHQPDGMKCVINHKDGNKQNNSAENLEVISNRENIILGFKKRGTKSNITGVTKHKSGKYNARFQHKLGNVSFKTETCPVKCVAQYVLSLKYSDSFDGNISNYKNKINNLI